MVKFKRYAIAFTMMCFSAMMGVGCSSPAKTSGTKQYIQQNQNKSITTDALTIKQYIGMKVDCEKEKTITKKDISEAVPEYLADNDMYDKDTTSEIKDGDEVNIAFVGKINGKEFKDGTTDNYDVIIGSKSLIDDFEQQLIGHKAGDKVEVKVTFPADYQEKSLAKKDAVFETTINYIKQPVEIPDKVTDEFISKYTEYKTVDDYKKFVKKSLAKEAADSFEANKEDAVTDALLKNTKIKTYPEDRVKDEVEYNNKYYKECAESMGISFKELIKQMGYDNQDSYNKDLETYAKSSVKYYMMCEAIANEEGIKITDADYQKKAKALAEEYGYENLTAMEREFTKDRVETVLLDREVTKFIVENTNFNYTEATTEQTIDTDSTGTSVSTETATKEETSDSNAGTTSVKNK